MTDHSIRPISSTDFDGIYDLYMDETVNPYMLYDPMDKSDFRVVFDELLKRDYSWIAEQNGKIHGMCFAKKGVGRIKHVATLLTLAVSKDFQGSGLAKRIVDEALSVLQRDGFLRIDLMAEADNAKGLAFYMNMGFHYEGNMGKYFRRGNESKYVDEISMSLTFG